MNWMFESRSKDYYYDDYTEGGVPTWYEYMLFPFILLPAAIIFATSAVFFAFFIFSRSCYEIAKNVSNSGKLEYPRLVLIGGGVAIILPSLILNNLFEVADHPIITFCALIFVILFTITPLTGLVWWLFKKSEHFSNSNDKQGA